MMTQLARLTLLIAASGLAACDVGAATAAENRENALPVPVEVSFPQRETVSATYQATATIGSDLSAPAIARVPGEVVEILVEEGDAVEEGQVLARLDGERLRLEMLSAKANLNNAQREYERNLDLHRRGLISASMFDGMKYDLEALEATYELAALQYDYSNIRAPIDGVVAHRDIRLGQNLKASEQAFRITETSELVSYLKIPQSELGKFTAGHVAKIRVAAMPDTEFTARIVRISPTIDTVNGTFRATAVIDNTVGLLAPGMFARFSIAYEKHENVLTVPSKSIVEEDGESIVYVVKNQSVERRRVTTGIVDNGVTEILDGLEGNEQIVVVGQGSISDGSRVLAQSTPSEKLTG